jgi:hypothetical protein
MSIYGNNCLITSILLPCSASLLIPGAGFENWVEAKYDFENLEDEEDEEEEGEEGANPAERKALTGSITPATAEESHPLGATKAPPCDVSLTGSITPGTAEESHPLGATKAPPWDDSSIEAEASVGGELGSDCGGSDGLWQGDTSMQGDIYRFIEGLTVGGARFEVFIYIMIGLSVLQTIIEASQPIVINYYHIWTVFLK